MGEDWKGGGGSKEWQMKQFIKRESGKGVGGGTNREREERRRRGERESEG